MRMIICTFFLLIHVWSIKIANNATMVVRGVNIDTSNFKNNEFQKLDVKILIEMNFHATEEEVRSNRIKFCLKGRDNRVININPYLDFSTNYNDEPQKRTFLNIKDNESLYVTLGISCFQFHALNKNYFDMNKPQKLKYLKEFVTNLLIYYNNKKLALSKKAINYSYKSVYYPLDPDKPNPVNNFIIVK